ncbi:MAG TPA: hypothetical protein VF244_00460, partial [Acidimicrobiales bacterium]
MRISRSRIPRGGPSPRQRRVRARLAANSGVARSVAAGLVLAVVGLLVVVWPASAATPTLVTQASASGFPVGVNLFDVATLGGGESPTGTITFNLFGPDDATCAEPPTFVSNVTVNGNGNYQSDSFTSSEAGTYQWVA